MTDDKPEIEFLDLSPDARVNEIMQRVVPAFADADFRQALAAVVHMFAMAISRCPREVRQQIVESTADTILKIADAMASIPEREPPR
jgi:hypothetical protein